MLAPTPWAGLRLAALVAAGVVLSSAVCGGPLDEANALGRQGQLAYSKGDLNGAEASWKAALVLLERLLPDSLHTAGILHNLGNFAFLRGQYAVAAPYYRRALAIRERVAPDSGPVAETLSSLARCAVGCGELAAAEVYLTRALAIRERLTPGSRAVAMSLLDLATNAIDRGDLPAASEHARRAQRILEQVAPGSAELATCLNLLGFQANCRGDLATANELLKQALALRERLVPGSEEVAHCLQNLGNVACDGGDVDVAEGYYRRALAIRSGLSPDSLEVAQTLYGLCHVAHDRGDLAAAEAYCQRALAIHDRLAPGSLGTVGSLNSLGCFATQRGDLRTAERYLRRALEIQRRHAPDSLDVSTILNDLATVFAADHRLGEAVACVDQAMAIEQKQLRHGFPALTEHDKAAFLGVEWPGLPLLLSLAELQPAEPQVVRSACKWVLRRKGIILSALLEDRQRLGLLANPAAAAAAIELQAARASLSHLVVAGPGAQSPEVYRQRSDELASRIGRLLQRLAEESGSVRTQLAVAEATTEKACDALRADSALVEIAAYTPFKVAAPGAWQAAEPRYVAFVLLPHNPQPRLVALGPAPPIDAAVGRSRRSLELSRSVALVPAPGAQRAVSGLYDLVWAKLEPHLGGAKRVYLSLDGQLNLAAFGGVRDPQGHFLAERYTFAYLASGRDLLRPTARPPGQRWLVVSNPDFGGEPGVAGGGQRAALGSDERSALAGADVRPLPGTKDEGERVAALGRSQGAAVEELSQAAATEARVKTATRPTVLHLATHGFFLPDVAPPAGGEGLRLAAVQPRDGSLPNPAFHGNPMQRSGLLLAGAARSLKGELTNGEDGILTAEEVVGMDLTGTQLVCLSACETGLGEVQEGEGVVGLRRAFQLAGAENLVMSLWSVPDAATGELMVEFYRRFAAGEAPPDAMTAAQRAFIAKRRAAGQSDAPLWWAAFVVGGR